MFFLIIFILFSIALNFENATFGQHERKGLSNIDDIASKTNHVKKYENIAI